MTCLHELVQLLHLTISYYIRIVTRTYELKLNLWALIKILLKGKGYVKVIMNSISISIYSHVQMASWMSILSNACP